MSAKRTKLQDRYELREVLGRGGMGIVYKAYDRLMNREVALKTILDVDSPETLQLFYKEWSVLVTMVHPNVINIYDIGEFEQDGIKKPFFVMPMLPGVTLDKLIKEGSPRLSVEGVVAIVEQAARGLHAAHEQGLVHRDVKPSNIFVMEDGSVKIIDFGIARDASAHSKTTLKGTLYYMAPEQLSLKPPSPMSDLFALGVVTYEALTRRRPFQGANEGEVIEAIQKHTPPPISELNHEVNYAISQVVHKAMAKQPWHRFYNIREYGDAVVKASRNEPLEYFDTAKIKPRLERATKSFEQGDYDFASEILSEMEAEGHLDQGIALLRRQVDQAVRQIRIKQTLENARRFFEAAEYPLALRKIQEALELDPQDAAALALKSQVEKERREKKIEEWIALARQHLENNAFRQAREALENVLQIKPNETDALRLAEEIDRREKEVARIRDEKGKLYQSAMNAWEKGEVTQALSKLEVLIAMDRDQPESDTRRSSTYQGFYNQVHSEHNALKNGYEEARRNLAADNFEAALATCKQYLTKYPNHALFQALKFDVEERQRQSLSSVIAETDRRVEAEPDLDRRVGILDEVLKSYPGEPHFERALQLVRDKRDLVNSIIAKARYLEEHNQFNEAQDQWQILKSIHEKQPGLAFEIERVIKRRDQQARQNAKARWVEQIDKYLEGGDYDRAAKTVERASSEFPNEPELIEMDKLVRKSQERARQARELLDRAREQTEKGAGEKALDDLRQAHELDPRNSVTRTVLINTLFEQARKSMDANSDVAEAAVKEILHLDPNHVPARSLESQIADRKREDFITWCMAQARRLQTDGDFGGALAVAAQGLAAFPNEPRLQQMKATLGRAQQEQQLLQTKPPTVVPKVPDAPPKPAVPNPPAPPAPVSVAPLRLDTQEMKAPAPVEPEKKVQRPAASSGTNRILIGALGAAAVVVALVGAALYSRRPAPKPKPEPVASVKVMLRSTPAGAEISVNGQVCGTSTCEMQLAPGDYRAEARMADYLPASASFSVGADGAASPEIGLSLAPVPPLLTIATDLSDGSVLLDRAPAGQIQGGELEIAKLAPGEHMIFLQNGGFRAQFALKIADNAAPQVDGAVQTQGMQGVVVVHAGSRGHVWGSAPGAKISVDGKDAGELGGDGLELQEVAAGPHELMMQSPGGETRVTFQGGPATTVAASLVTNQNLGVLNIVAGEDDAEIYLNGDKYRRKTRNGRVRIYLPAKQYAVRIQKDGVVAQEQTVALKRGQESELQFKLTPAKATLAIHRGVPGSEVSLDGSRIGIVKPDGEFSSTSIEPGRHTISIRGDRYKPVQTEQVFAAGKSVEMDGTLQTLFGTLKVDVSPAVPGVRLRLKRQGDAQDREIHESTLSLQDGLYTITASAAKYQDAAVTVRVTPGNSATATIAMKKVEPSLSVKLAPVQDNPAPPPFLLNDWLKGGGWTRDGVSIKRQGGDFIIAPPVLAAGTIQFTILSIHGRRVEWVAGFRDTKNYYLYQFEDSSFTRTEVADGKHSKAVKVQISARHDHPNAFLIQITPKSIIHSVPQGPNWKLLDSWSPEGGVVAGKFGFRVPGRDEISLSDFKLTQN